MFPPEAPPYATFEDNEDELPARIIRSVRLRVGRGGRRMLDRRDIGLRTMFIKRPKLDQPSDVVNPMDRNDEDEGEEEEEDHERRRRIEEQWRYDQDDMPAVGPQGQDEQDRVLVDEYQTKYVEFFAVLVFPLTSAISKVLATCNNYLGRQRSGGISNR